MSHYSLDELAVMAQTVVLADTRDDERAFMLYMVMSSRTGLSPNKVKARIQEMACASQREPVSDIC